MNDKKYGEIQRMVGQVSIHQFQEILEKQLREIEEQSSGKLTFHNIQKNGEELHAISYARGGSNVRPTLYVEQFYQDYLKGVAVEVLAEEIFKKLEYHFNEIRVSDKEIIDAMKIENVVPVLVPREKYREMLKQVPHIPLADLEIIFKIVYSKLGVGGVDYALMNRWGVNEAELLETALSNSIYKDRIKVMPLADAVSSLHPEGTEYFFQKPIPMLVVTNENLFYGAAAILDKDTMGRVREMLGEEPYILPSSLHECATRFAA